MLTLSKVLYEHHLQDVDLLWHTFLIKREITLNTDCKTIEFEVSYIDKPTA